MMPERRCPVLPGLYCPKNCKGTKAKDCPRYQRGHAPTNLQGRQEKK